MDKNQYKDRDWLYDQYVNKEKSTVEIAEMFNVAPSSIGYWLDKFGINTRSLSESLEGREVSKDTRNKISQSVSEHIEEHGHPFEGQTHTDESKEKMSKAKQGENNHFYNESRPEFAKRMSGSNNPSYKDGRSYDMDFRTGSEWTNFSNELKELADWTCENCGAHGSNAELHSHHAKPVSNGGDKYDNVFIVLCKSCHGTPSSFWHNSTVGQQIAAIGGEPISEIRS